VPVFFIDSNIGWVLGGPTGLLKTTNGGIDWVEKPILESTFGDVYFIDENTGWVIGFEPFPFGPTPILQKTTDGGESWTELSEEIGQALCFIDSNVGWYVDGGTVFSPHGSIRKTTDGGLTFVEQSGDTLSSINDVCFLDGNTGWVVGDVGRILHTTNGGENWELQMRDVWQLFRSVDFIDENFGWAVGIGGVIFNTTNGGEDWYEQESGVNEHLFSVCFTDNNTGWTVGYGGKILKTTNGGVTFVEESEIDEIPTDYSLSQNYPNPFNPTTKIRYTVPQISNVVIKAFDILGNEIEILVNEEKQTGTYEITWSAEGLPSGVYFYRIQAGSFVDTKKMILLK